ncbi:MAG: hypothetical protein H0W72_14710, partial [Planctomycetes bacterium]|nr:hypothetical protein [Planctomycetota bacterium]
LDLLGGYRCREAAWTLVDLLDDGLAPLRVAASAALAPAATGGFGYDPADRDQSRRRAAVERWAAWCAQAYGPRPVAAAAALAPPGK